MLTTKKLFLTYKRNILQYAKNRFQHISFETFTKEFQKDYLLHVSISNKIRIKKAIDNKNTFILEHSISTNGVYLNENIISNNLFQKIKNYHL